MLECTLTITHTHKNRAYHKIGLAFVVFLCKTVNHRQKIQSTAKSHVEIPLIVASSPMDYNTQQVKAEGQHLISFHCWVTYNYLNCSVCVNAPILKCFEVCRIFGIHEFFR